MSFSNQPLDSNGVPIANLYVQDSGFIATEGSTTTETDGLGNTSTCVNVNIHQVNDALITTYIGTDDILGNGILKVIAAMKNGDGGYDEPRNNQDGITLINASSVTTTQTSTQQTNYNGRGAIIIFTMIDASASPSVTLSITGVEPVTGSTWTILTGSAITANGVHVYRVYPSLTAVANTTASDIIPRTWEVTATANNSNSGTYKVNAIIMAN